MPDTPQVWLNDTQVNPVDATNPFSYYNPTVTQLTNGNIVVVYDDNGGRSADGGPSHWRLYDPVGTVIASGVTDDSAGNPIVVALGDGGFMIADDYATGLTTGSVVEAWRYDADGTFQNYAAIDNRLWAGIGDEPSDNRLQASAANDINTMIVYTAYDGGIYGQLYARIYTPALGLVGPELQIASPGDPFNGPNLVYGNAHIAGVDAVALANGNYAVAYGVSNGLSGSSEVSNVQVVIFNDVGTQIIEQTVIDNGLANTDPSITALEGGGLVVTWTLDGTGGTDSGIRLKVLDGAGSPLTGTINPLTTTTGNQNEPVVAALADGGFVVIWDDDNLSDIKGQRFDAFGNRIGTEFTIDAAGSQTAIEVVGLEDGRFAVTWQESDQIRMEFYDVRDLPTLMDYDGANLQIGTTGNDVMTDVAVGADRIYGNGGNDR
ncbi:MAG: hypothetical protein KDJ77_20070, partial [Rhodobiaceae bacterium]|nr:hypothetical protein [Rhodobiaceae bacterium]